MSSPRPTPAMAPATPAGPADRRKAGFWEPVAVRSLAVAAVFVAVVVALLAWDYGHRLVKDPLDSAEFQVLKKRLAELKQQEQTEAVQREFDETLAAIRAEDFRLRQAYFRQRRFAGRGAWLLLGGIGVLLVAAKALATLRRKLPAPELQAIPQDTELQIARIGRWSVAGLGVLLVAAAVALTVGVRTELAEVGGEAAGPSGDLAPVGPATVVPPAVVPPAVVPAAVVPPAVVPQPEPSVAGGPKLAPTAHPADAPSKEEFAKNWPGFRGPAGSGISAYNNVPTKWDVKTGDTIAWKTPVPLEGNSSPIVWNNRVFLTGASEAKRQVYCFDAADGKLVWQKDAPGTPASTAKPPKVMEATGFAAPTPATDGRRVYASFANGDLAAFDFAGKLAWARSLGIPNNHYGHAASLRVARGLLIVQLDQGVAKDGLSKLMALDTATGQTVWETKREIPVSWCTPIVIDVSGQEEIATCGDPWVIAYRLDDGKEIWRADCLRQEIGPSPVFADGIVYAAVEYKAASAIRADGQGDVTQTHVLWLTEDDVPDLCSPLATPQHVFLLTTAGTLTCYDAKKGKKLWLKDIDSRFAASPSLAGQCVYLFGEEGKVFLVEPGPTEGKTVFETDMGENVVASPAFQDGRIYVRTKSQLVCIGKK